MQPLENNTKEIDTTPDLIFLGGIGDNLWLDNGKHYSRNYKQGYRVYDANGVASAINLGSGLGGSSGLYLVREKRKNKEEEK